MQPEARRVDVVPHTHWDREWYSPFPTFRWRLLDLVDDLLDRLEVDPGFRLFLLDGQLAMVDDYLALRPEATERVRRLAAAGRLVVGPWYVLPDEFLVSGETLVRNLEVGRERAAAFGGTQDVGYLPDMFGHVAQMPQILAAAGLRWAVVWRGVPAAVDRTRFVWVAPDGTAVPTEVLWRGYSNGAELGDDADDLARRLDAYAETVGAAQVGPVLWMHGGDHRAPEADLAARLAALAGLGAADPARPGWDPRWVSPAEHLATGPWPGDLPRWHGEMRSAARSNVLAGTLSNRVDVKVAAARVERTLEHLAEPLAALHLPAGRYPHAVLERAWLDVLRNAAHDSICACSHDEVVDAVHHRYAEALRSAEGVVERSLDALGDAAPAGTVVVNAVPRPRSGLVLVRVPSPGPAGAPGNVQLLEDPPGLPDSPPDPVGPPPGTRPALVRAVDVPGFGWQRWRPGPLDVAPVTVRHDGDRLAVANGEIAVVVDVASATFALDGVAGIGRLVDGGDQGDTYTHAPPPRDLVVDRPRWAGAEVTEHGPLRACCELVARYAWPAHVDDAAGCRVGSIDHEVRTTLDVRAGDPLVRVTMRWTNSSRDHRLRVVVPLRTPATGSLAECAFGTVARGLVAEGGPEEDAVGTFPSRRFVQAGGVTVVHEGLTEYELADVRDGRAHALALTVLRATGWLSRPWTPTRRNAAGPAHRLEGAQCLGPREVRWAVAVDPPDGARRDPWALAGDAFTPLLVTEGRRTSPGPDETSALDVSGAEVTALRRVRGGGLELRVVNPTDGPATCRIPGRRGQVVDLRGQPLGPFDGAVTLGPHRIATLRVDG